MTKLLERLSFAPSIEKPRESEVVEDTSLTRAEVAALFANDLKAFSAAAYD